MMLKNIFTKSLFVAFLAIGLISCQEDQEVADVIDPSTKPLATIEPSRAVTGSITEGDTITFDVSLTKSIVNDPISFTARMVGDSGATADDIAVVSGVVNPYEKTATVTLVVLADGKPEATESLKLEVGAFTIQQNFQLNPESDVITVDLNITNVNAPDVLTTYFIWTDDADDYDVFVTGEDGNFYEVAATGDYPEIGTNFGLDAPDQTYYMGIDPWATPSDASTNYEVRFGYGNQVAVFEGVFDPNNTDQYETDNGFYTLVDIVKSGSSFTFTNVNE